MIMVFKVSVSVSACMFVSLGVRVRVGLEGYVFSLNSIGKVA